MQWAEIKVLTSHEAREAVASMLHEVGAGGVVIEDGETERSEGKQAWQEKQSRPLNPSDRVLLKAYFPVSDQLKKTATRLSQQLEQLKNFGFDTGAAHVTVGEIDAEDWETAWKKYYKPVRISKRLVVKPSWEPLFDAGDSLVIELDPGMAFGTGTHPSTILALRALEETIDGGERVIDVGCGSGILSIAAVKLGAQDVLALDIDEVAVKATAENAMLNGVSSQVNVQQNDCLNGITLSADIVVANILAEVIVTFVPDAARLISSGGTFIASGIIKEKETLVKQTLTEAPFFIVDTLYQDDWVAILAKRR